MLMKIRSNPFSIIVNIAHSNIKYVYKDKNKNTHIIQKIKKISINAQITANKYQSKSCTHTYIVIWIQAPKDNPNNQWTKYKETKNAIQTNVSFINHSFLLFFVFLFIIILLIPQYDCK